ncbi:indolepyruvate ferredoxin oxidoreductase family protein [Acinetobacter courvalinii]|uniref:indolepyruvate ferredoxin oxidoreductase family protein n=1 Tax=Acinetobacter courvalinii TaxID=280147 RepID=UPI0021D310F6|nr:indolepyruvate ferredoxin oxidoreductase family protein [Acinetobacter courvalinii]MCU4367414.1 indolepyruvate ferredoxin oxidoreductase family protein [Acinetobacter courvalinii]MCU4445620.1 indolepyruvate ferredoxin oxidoreductase family protein [Acinetobacter courvalinii]
MNIATKVTPKMIATKDVSLDDKYISDHGSAYMTGIQALVRLPLAQTRRDELNGLHTAGFISGYRGSPVGNYDNFLWQIGGILKDHHVVFQPGINEDLAATAIWGTQQANLAGQGKYDGVTSWWYGKGPGVDRSGDVLRHANLAGTAEHGGVVALFGDDHSCKSSTVPHQSEHVMIGCGIPIFYPTSVQHILDLGVHAVAMSRFAGLWTSMKLVSEIVETSASVNVDLDRVIPVIPENVDFPADGVNIRWPDHGIQQEQRLYQHRLPAVLAYARANQLNQTTWPCENARIGIVASGKGYLDTIEALRILGIENETAQQLGLRVYQVGLIWPLEPQGIREFAKGLQELIVVEEKRPILESQIKDELYSLPDQQRPHVIGKAIHGKGEWSTSIEEAPLIGHYEFQPEPIAKMLAARFLQLDLPENLRQQIQNRIDLLQKAERESRRVLDLADRKPYFCSGCPHNTSTVVPEGSRALGGIGCHYIAVSLDRGTETFSQMGGEGVSWAGASHFTNEKHIFANLGDGTYFHSGYLAIRQAIAANINITYKILYNDAVAMTGGQHVDGHLSVAQLTRQLDAEGIKKQVIVTDEPALIHAEEHLAPNVEIRHRNDLDAVQRELRDISGVTALVYVQTCASEKRRRRKRDMYPDPAERLYINSDICEGCGDCSKKSNCLSIEPVETALGIKRQINQSSCNKDFTCVEGFCPSFVTVHTRDMKRPDKFEGFAPGWPERPVLPQLDATPSRIMVGGVGGTGVVTVGALLGMAAHLEGKAARVMDMAGLAQKGGTVYSYVQLASDDEQISATKIPAGQCDLLIGADAVVAGSNAALSRLKPDAMVIVNEDGSPTSDFINKRDWFAPITDLINRLRGRVDQGKLVSLPAARIATQVLGDAIFANQLLLGMAWQSGQIPLLRESIEKAIQLNGTAVEKNLEAFRVGCHLASDPDLAKRLLDSLPKQQVPQTLPELIDDCSVRLQDYWNDAYANTYRNLAEQAAKVLPEELAGTIATQLYRVMAYKDEYEVARLLTGASFKKSIESQFGRGVRLSYHLAPPTLGTNVRKRIFGYWMRFPMMLLARLQWLRETFLDPFARQEERQHEHAWRDRYIDFVKALVAAPQQYDLTVAAQIAELPAEVRGFGHVKMQAMQSANQRWDELSTQLNNNT